MNEKGLIILIALISMAAANDYEWTPPPYGSDQFSVSMAIAILYLVGFILVLFLSLFTAYKCYKKRQVAKRVKDEMYLKQTQFASSMGMSVLQLRNDRRFGLTNHV